MTGVPPASSAGPDGSGDNAANLTLPVIGGVVGGMALIIVAIMVTMVIIFVVRAKNGLKHFYFGSNRRSVNYDHVYDPPINYDHRPLPPPVNTIPPRLTMFTNDAYNTSSILPYTIGTHETTAVEENHLKGRVKMQENEAYQPTTDHDHSLHLIDNPAYGTNAANAPDISTETNMAYKQTNLIDGHSDSVEVAVQDIITAEESGACATVYVSEAAAEET